MVLYNHARPCQNLDGPTPEQNWNELGKAYLMQAAPKRAVPWNMEFEAKQVFLTPKPCTKVASRSSRDVIRYTQRGALRFFKTA